MKARLRRLEPALVALATFAAFLPALRGGLLWVSDDSENLMVNFHFRGLGWSELRWMFTTAYLGPYQPLTWLSYALDYKVWGMNPMGYHLTSLLLHALNAGLFYLVAWRLFALAWRAEESESATRLAAAAAALLFSVHPLRVEAVAWATERRTALCGTFYLAAVLCYLRERRAASLGFFGLSLLSKGISVTLPVTLAALEWHPLRRLDRRTATRLAPFFALALAFGVVELAGYASQDRLGLEGRWLGARLAIASWSALFYLWKTTLPWGLHHLYGLPAKIEPISAFYVPCALGVLALNAGLAAARERRPAALAAWVHYLAAFLPVSGVVGFGAHIAADRYTYIACMGWPLLAAGAFRRRPAPLFAAAAILAALSWRQCGFWRDSETLWRRETAFDPSWALPRSNLAFALLSEGKVEEAAGELTEVLRLHPGYPPALDSWGEVLMRRGRFGEAAAHYGAIARRQPQDANIRAHWADALERSGKPREALAQYAEAFRLDPRVEPASNGFANALMRLGRFKDAEARYREAARLEPANAGLRVNLGDALLSQRRLAEAEAEYAEAARLDPANARAFNNLGAVLLMEGRDREAAERLRRALALEPGYAQARTNLRVIERRRR